MKLPIASKYILSEVEDYTYLCCFCNGFSTTIKYVTTKNLDDFYDDKCIHCNYLYDSCDGGSSVLEEDDCFEFNINEFKEDLYIKVNVPNHVYIEKYDNSAYSRSYLFVLDQGVFKAFMFPNVHDSGEICFKDAYANTPATRYSNYWNSEFNDDLTADCLIYDPEALEDYLTNWSIEEQNNYYNVKSYNLSEYINENKYIESDTATDIVFLIDQFTNKNYIGLGTHNNNNLNINYL